MTRSRENADARCVRWIRCFLVAAATAGLVTTPLESKAQWLLDGNPPCPSPPCEGRYPSVLGDGAGGAYVHWLESYSDPVNDRLRLSHVRADATIAIGWGEQRLGTTTPYVNGPVPELAPDGALFAHWEDYRNGPRNGFILKFLPNGTLAPGWDPEGVLLGVPAIGQSGILALPGTDGGAHVVWYDERGGMQSVDTYIQRFTPTGALSSGWPAGGRLLLGGPAHQVSNGICSDGEGGVIITLGDMPNGDADLYVQRITADGTFLWGDSASASLIMREPLHQVAHAVHPDGRGGYMVLGSTAENYFLHAKLFTQRIRGDGTRDPSWPAEGKVFYDIPGDPVSAYAPVTTSDGVGGYYFGWTDFRNYGAAVYVQHLDSNGERAPGWPVNGRRVNATEYYTYDIDVAPDGQGGVYLCWFTYDPYTPRIFVQHLRSDGLPAPGWPEGGRPVTTTIGSSATEDWPAITSDGRGGAYVAWQLYVPSNESHEVRITRLVPDGPVATSLSLVSANATPGAVALDWFAPAGDVALARVQRRTEPGEWSDIAAISADGEDHLRYIDRAVEPGARYAYRLAYATGETSESWVNVPLGVRFALQGAQPNPAPRGALRVAFALESAAPATLALHDVTGRRVLSREVGALGAGEHVTTLRASSEVRPGMYWLHLQQGPRTATARVAVIE